MQCNIIIINSASENSTSIYLFIIILFIIIITYYKYFNNPATSATNAFFNCIDHFNFYSTIFKYIGIVGLLREMGSLGRKFYLCLLNARCSEIQFIMPASLKAEITHFFMHFQNPKLGYLPENRVSTQSVTNYLMIYGFLGHLQNYPSLQHYQIHNNQS